LSAGNRWVADLARLTLRHAGRLVVLVFGATIVLLGLVMVVTPGPGILVIFLGLGLLALEFAWAARLLRRANLMASEMAGRKRRSVSGQDQAGPGAGLGTG
jgi:tellurite resistance protein TerC